MDTNLSPLLEFESPEFIKSPKTADWYWGIFIASAIGIFLSVYLQNYLFAGVILLSGILLIVISTQPSHMVKVSFYDNTLFIGPKKLKYSELEAFSFDIHFKDNKRVIFKSQRLNPEVFTLPLNPELESLQEDIERILTEKGVAKSEISVPILTQTLEALF